MAQLGESFDHSTVAARENPDPIPAGTYLAEIIESDVVPTKAGDGERLTLTWKVTGGPYDGRRVWDSLNIKNPNATAQRIAQGMLKELCEAAGHRGNLDDTDHLHGIPMRIRVSVKPAEGNYSAKNEVKKYSADDGAPPVSSTTSARSTPSATPQASTAGKAAGTRPWNKPAA